MADKDGKALWGQVVETPESKRCGVAESLWVDKCLSRTLEILLTWQHVQEEERYVQTKSQTHGSHHEH